MDITTTNELSDRQLFLLGDTMHEFIKYIDGSTLINFWLSNTLQSMSKSGYHAVVNYTTLCKYIEQCHFNEKVQANHNAGNRAMDIMSVSAADSELYFCGDLMSLKKKVAFHCDIELNLREPKHWNEEWNHKLQLNKYQQFSKIFHGYKREQNTKFIHFKQQIPTPKENELQSSKQWMECVNMNNLLKFLFDSTTNIPFESLDVYVLDYDVMRNMEQPVKFERMENVTICFVKNNNFYNVFVAREWQQYQA